jgi:dethiobiotin synthetase
MKARGFFIAGTDTGVGKTHVCCGLIAGFRRLGQTAGGMKPVLAGIESDDVREIAAVSAYSPHFNAVCTYRLEAATAPNIAAEREGKGIEIAPIVADLARCSAIQALTVVEGTGGWLCPISSRETMADVARALGLPVVLVVGLRLGCLNHALLTAEAISQAGLPLAGWIANTIDPRFTDADTNIAFLRQRLDAPLLATLSHSPRPAAVAADLEHAAKMLAQFQVCLK